jgi:hypothetical protein
MTSGGRSMMMDEFLMARGSNTISIAVALIAALYIIVVLSGALPGDEARFIGLVVIGGAT